MPLVEFPIWETTFVTTGMLPCTSIFFLNKHLSINKNQQNKITPKGNTFLEIRFSLFLTLFQKGFGGANRSAELFSLNVYQFILLYLFYNLTSVFITKI